MKRDCRTTGVVGGRCAEADNVVVLGSDRSDEREEVGKIHRGKQPVWTMKLRKKIIDALLGGESALSNEITATAAR